LPVHPVPVYTLKSQAYGKYVSYPQAAFAPPAAMNDTRIAERLLKCIVG
jgi:hypothetical protein